MPLFSKFLYILISCDKAWIADTLIPIWNSCSFVESQLRSKHVKVKLFILHRLRNKLLQLIEIIPVGTIVCVVFMWVETLSTLNTAVLSTKWQHDYPMSTLVIKQGLKRWKGSSLPQHLVSEWLVLWSCGTDQWSWVQDKWKLWKPRMHFSCFNRNHNKQGE